MIWRKSKFWASLVAAATLIGLIEAAQVYTGTAALGSPTSAARALGSTLPSWYVLTLLVPVIILLAHRFPLEQGRWRVSLPIHLAASVLFATAHLAVSSWLSNAIVYAGGSPPPFAANLSRAITLYFVIELVTYFAIVGAHHAYIYGRRIREREQAAAQLAMERTRLEASLVRANLDALRMQLNPHFLFNTLNVISVLALKGERQGVVRTLTLLSDLLRATLEQTDQLVTLREELQLLDLYLEIELVRFRDRLAVERDVPQELLDAEVPTLLLQPLVENAIRHGIANSPGPGRIRIEAAVVQGDLELRVLDTGPGVSRVPAGSAGTGVGLPNTRARLEQLYGTSQTLDLGDRPDGQGAMVTVRLPLRRFRGDGRTGPATAAAVSA